MTIEDTNALHWTQPTRRTRPRHSVFSKLPDRPQEGDEGYQPHPGRRLSESEFVTWIVEKTRAEWVDGEVQFMSPVNLEHDSLQVWLTRLLGDFLEARDLGRVHGSEFLVRLPGKRRFRLTDLFYATPAKDHLFAKARFEGAPDLVIEIVSPDDPSRDYRDKFTDYQNAGVQEYWIIDPTGQHLEVHEMVKGIYKRIPEKTGAIHSKVLKGFFIREPWLWQKPLPKIGPLLREMGIK